MKPCLLLAFFAVSCLNLVGQSIDLRLDREDGVFNRNESIVVTAETADLDADTIHVKVWKNNNELLLDTSLSNTSEAFSIFEGKFDESCSVIVEASSGETKEQIGAIVDPTNLKPGSPRPRDFGRYWKKQKALLSKLPFEVKEKALELSDEDAEDYEAFSLEINSPGPRPARGYFAKPKNAAEKSLPIVVFLRAAGVKGEWCRSNLDQTVAFAKMGNGSLSFDLNAHGMLNGQPEAYYEELEEGALKRYWEKGVEDRDTYYFRFMYLRMLRSIEYLTRQPKWDGQRILVIGESQGGGQALAAAGLDNRVSAVVATVPAMCDFGGPLVGRKGGWPQPLESHEDQPGIIKTTSYFDAAHLLQGSKATFVVEIGLIDRTCPSTSIYAALNQAKGEKTILSVPYRGHPWPEELERKIWDETVLSVKDAFIESYLK